MFDRTAQGPIARWWWTVDRTLLAALMILMLGGLILSLAASPAVAERLELDPFHFVKRHALFLAPTLGVMLMTSMLEPTSSTLGRRTKYFTSSIREVLSARSSIRPMRKKCQASPCAMVSLTIPPKVTP